MQLWNKHGTRPINAFYPDNFDDVQAAGFGFAGTPATVLDALQGPGRRDAGSTISSAASPSATWRWRNRSARSSCSPST